uniref:Uncharacterized protein n=1 Tax=Parascaris univalens TaxID=6257 RepID=A0A915AQ54_PARUN
GEGGELLFTVLRRRGSTSSYGDCEGKMNQNLVPAYFQAGSISTTPQQTSAPTQMTIQPAGTTTFFQPTSGTPFNATNSGPVFHSSTTAFLPNSNIQLQPASTVGAGGQPPQQMRLVQAINPSTLSTPVTSGQQGATVLAVVTAQNANGTTMQILQPQPHGESDEKRIAALLDSYFVEQQAPTTSGVTPLPTTAVVATNTTSYPSPASIVAKYTNKNKMVTPEKREKDEAKRAKQAEAARLRYHRLSAEEKRELNVKRTLAQKRKRQREKEMEELEELLRQTNDIQEDPEITEQLREKRMRARWAEAARTRYQRMSSEERRAHNNRRRMRQIAAAEGLKGPDGQPDEDAIRRHIKEQNAKKAEAARLRYHRMTEEEKRAYNQRRTEAFRRRRMEEEMLLAMPIGRINGEALDRAQQIVVRNAKRAEAARLRYQRMTPEQRKAYNQKRYTPKRKRDSADGESNGGRGRKKTQDEFDALTTLERDVIKRTQQAQQALMRQQRNNANVTTTATYLTTTPVQGTIGTVGTVGPVGTVGTVVQGATAATVGTVGTVGAVQAVGTMGTVGTHIQQQQVQQQPQQVQTVQTVQAQQMTQIPQQVQFQVQHVHPQQIQQQQQSQQQQAQHQQQIQYANVQVASNGQMMVGQRIQQQMVNPYATVPPRA